MKLFTHVPKWRKIQRDVYHLYIRLAACICVNKTSYSHMREFRYSFWVSYEDPNLYFEMNFIFNYAINVAEIMTLDTFTKRIATIAIYFILVCAVWTDLPFASHNYYLVIDIYAKTFKGTNGVWCMMALIFNGISDLGFDFIITAHQRHLIDVRDKILVYRFFEYFSKSLNIWCPWNADGVGFLQTLFMENFILSRLSSICHW